MLLKTLPGLLCVILLSHSSYALWGDWSRWSDCSEDCGSGQNTRTRTCKTEPCFGDSSETQTCDQLCGCQLNLCGAGTCIQNSTSLKDYDCACPPNYSGNNSQDCNTGITELSPNISSFGTSIISSPFYPAPYPPLVNIIWKIQPQEATSIRVSFDYFNVEAPGSSDCVNDYKTVQDILTVNAIGSYSMTETEVNRACPCIYDMLVVTAEDVSSITDSSAVYCSANPPPSNLHFSNSEAVTVMFRTDQTTYRPPGSGVPGFQISVAVGNCGSSPCLNGGSCTETPGSFMCACAGNFTGNTCQMCVPGATCVGVDPCLSSPCLNDGTCQTDGVGTYTCECPTPWSGMHCDNDEAGPSVLLIVLPIVLIIIVISIIIVVIIYCRKRNSTGGKGEYQLQSKTGQQIKA